MLEAVMGQTFTTVVSAPAGFTTAADMVLYRAGAASGITPTAAQIGSTNAWSVSFTPNATGVYSLYVFGGVQLRVNVVLKASTDLLRDLSDEALGSWSWNKQTGVLSLVRQDGTALASFTMTDNLTVSSRERV